MADDLNQPVYALTDLKQEVRSIGGKLNYLTGGLSLGAVVLLAVLGFLYSEISDVKATGARLDERTMMLTREFEKLDVFKDETRLSLARIQQALNIPVEDPDRKASVEDAPAE